MGAQTAGVLLVTIFVAIFFGFTAGMSIALSDSGAMDAMTMTDELVLLTEENLMIISLIASFACFAAFFPMWLETRKRIEPRRNKAPAVVGLFTTGMFIGANLLLVSILNMIDVTMYFPDYIEVMEDMFTGSILMQVLVIGIAAPVIEELCFRGILMSRMLWLPTWASILIQGVIFGVIHLNMLQGMYAFLIGLVFGWIYIKYRSITLAIIAHMAFNLTSIILPEIVADPPLIPIMLASIVIVGACAVPLIILPHAKVKDTEPTDTVLPIAAQ